jgi:hypothetical protein
MNHNRCNAAFPRMLQRGSLKVSRSAGMRPMNTTLVRDASWKSDCLRYSGIPGYADMNLRGWLGYQAPVTGVSVSTPKESCHFSSCFFDSGVRTSSWVVDIRVLVSK